MVKIIEPSYEILTDIDHMAILKMIERAGRVCYKSEDLITEDSAKGFVERILKRGHESVIEHAIVTVKFICDRGVTHEIVRHRIASYSQESTRYCNYSKDKFGNEITVINPFFFDPNEPCMEGTVYNKYLLWKKAVEQAEELYLALLKVGASPQEARSVLPNSLKTEIVCTFNIREWRHFFRLRTSKAAHPQMRQLVIPLFKVMREKIPVVFDDIDLEEIDD